MHKKIARTTYFIQCYKTCVMYPINMPMNFSIEKFPICISQNYTEKFTEAASAMVMRRTEKT